MDVLGAVAWGGAGITAAVGLELGAARLLRAVLLAREPLSGEHIDSAVYHRSLWTPGQPELWPARIALAASGVLVAADLGGLAGWLMEPALLAWCGALAWDLWTWERVAASVKFVTWRRGWQRGARRVAVSELREVQVVQCPRPRSGPGRLRPDAAHIVLRLADGSARLPATLAWFGGEAHLEEVANFVRMQMDVVADNRRRAAADKRAAVRRARQAPPPPVHPATKIDPQALPRVG
jgi:hypothetical protein